MTDQSRVDLWNEIEQALKEAQAKNQKDVPVERGVELTPERLRSIIRYHPDTGHLYWIGTGERAGAIQDKGYRTIEVDGKAYYAHRIAWFHHYGKWPEEDLDHINRSRDDNRIENLRDVSRSENNRNRKSWSKASKAAEEELRNVQQDNGDDVGKEPG